jgi:ABC-2 type transport system ATP-binding protein
MRYGEREALCGVSFDVAAGELVAVVGPNGAGKTTLLSILAGIQRPSAGSVNRLPSEVGWVPQQPALYSKLSVAENLAMFARLEHVADPQQAVERMLEQTGLRERAAELLGRLSGGNRQRVNVAIGLLSSPPVLALDEPSTALDPGQRERLWSFIRGLAADGTSVVFSTHDVNEVQRYAARALVLADGRLLFDGSPAAFLAAAGEQPGGDSIGDFEDAFVSFLRARSHR